MATVAQQGNYDLSSMETGSRDGAARLRQSSGFVRPRSKVLVLAVAVIILTVGLTVRCTGKDMPPDATGPIPSEEGPVYEVPNTSGVLYRAEMLPVADIGEQQLVLDAVELINPVNLETVMTEVHLLEPGDAGFATLREAGYQGTDGQSDSYVKPENRRPLPFPFNAASYDSFQFLIGFKLTSGADTGQHNGYRISYHQENSAEPLEFSYHEDLYVCTMAQCPDTPFHNRTPSLPEMAVTSTTEPAT